MKKQFRAILLAGVMLLMLCSVVLADAELPSGVYNLVVTNGYTVTPDGSKASDDELKALKADEALKGITEFWMGTQKFNVSYTSSDATSPEQYIVLMLKGDADGAAPTAPTKENIVYINQDASVQDNGKYTITFSTVYPSSLEAGCAYYIYLTSASSSSFAETRIASFRYYEPYMLGDVNDDKKLTEADASVILQFKIGKAKLEGSNLKAADVNKDNNVSEADASLILQKLIGKVVF